MQQEMSLVFFFQAMGPWLWVVLPFSLITLYAIVKGTIDVIKAEKKPEKIYREMHAIPFFASLTAMLGFIGQILGLWQAIAAIIVATDVSPEIVLMGFRISFFSTIYGIITLLVALVCWFILIQILNKRISD